MSLSWSCEWSDCSIKRRSSRNLRLLLSTLYTQSTGEKYQRGKGLDFKQSKKNSVFSWNMFFLWWLRVAQNNDIHFFSINCHWLGLPSERMITNYTYISVLAHFYPIFSYFFQTPQAWKVTFCSSTNNYWEAKGKWKLANKLHPEGFN